MILADFDGTLIDKDSMLGFYLEVCKQKKNKFLLVPLYVICMILHKINLMDNFTLKSYGVIFFLRGLSEKQVNIISKQYGERLILNNLGKQLIEKNVVVITASFQNYVEHACPKHWIIIGTTWESNDGFITGLENNLYGENKFIRLSKKYSENHFEICYTDSMSDKSIFFFAKKSFIVKTNETLKEV